MNSVKKKNSSKKPASKKVKEETSEEVVEDTSLPSVWKCRVPVTYHGRPYSVGQTILVPPHQISPELEKYFEKTKTETFSIVSDPAHLLEGDK